MSSSLDVVVQGRDQASAVLQAVSAKIASMQGTTIQANQVTVDSFKDMRQEVRLNSSALRTLGMAFREDMGPTYQFATALNATGQVFSRLTNAYQAYNVMQIREQQALGGVTQAQQNYNQAVQQYGPASQQATAATKQLQVAQEQYQQVVQQNIVGKAELGLQVGTTLPLQIMQSIIAWETYKTIAGSVGGTNATLFSTLKGVASGFGTVASYALPLLPIIGGIGFAFSDAGKFAGETMRTMVKDGKPLEALALGLSRGFLQWQIDMDQTNVTLQNTSQAIGSASMSMEEYSKKYYSAIEGMRQYPPTFEMYAQQDLVINIDYNVKTPHIPDIPPKEYDIEGNVIEPYIPQPPDQTYNIWGILHEVSKNIFGFQQGTPYVPETGLALLHKGEAVIPASQNTMTSHMVNYNQISSNMDLNIVLAKLEQSMVSAYRKVTG